MIPGLLLPGALVALAALAVPLALHIARRSEPKPLDFAALRWLREKPRPRARMRIDEWPLLMARLLLLALVAVWLARPVLLGARDSAPYVAVVPGAAFQAADPRAEAHWLAPGFPDFKQAKPALGADTGLASLIRQLDADLPRGRPLTIVTPAVIQGADGERPRLSRRIDWRIVPGAMPAGAARTSVVPGLSIRYDAGHAPALRYLRAAALSWQPEGREADLDVARIEAALPVSSRKLVWLGTGPLPPALARWIEAGGTAVVSAEMTIVGRQAAVVWRDELDRPLAEAWSMEAGRLVRLTRPLTPAEAPQLLAADFPVQLRALLDPPAAAPARVAAADYAPLVGARAYERLPRELQPALAILIGLVLLGERWLATRRTRAVSP